MNGEQLYGLYADIHDRDNNCMIDEWSQLDKGEQEVWNTLAVTLAV